MVVVTEMWCNGSDCGGSDTIGGSDRDGGGDGGGAATEMLVTVKVTEMAVGMMVMAVVIEMVWW